MNSLSPGCATGAAMFIVLLLVLALGALWSGLAGRKERRHRREILLTLLEQDIAMKVALDRLEALGVTSHLHKTPAGQKDQNP